MTYRIFLHPKAADFLIKCDQRLRHRIKNRLRVLEDRPEAKGEQLKYSRFRRLRIGNYRAIYTVKEEDKKVVILFIGHRRKVYDDFTRLF